jgi:hypothetical protein
MMPSGTTVQARPATGYAVFVYDYGQEIFLVRVEPRRHWSRGERLLGTAACCLFYAYVYYLIFTK